MPKHRGPGSAARSQTDIFKFWSQVGRHDKLHPADRPIFARVKRHGFDLRCLPACFGGRLRTAPVVFLYLSPGFSRWDLIDARTKRGRDRYAERRRGNLSLGGPEDHKGAWQWWSSRTKCFGDWRQLRSKIAFLNIGGYHSKTFGDIPLLAALPSSRVSLDWAQSVLFPQAIRGERVVVCLRAARFWGLSEGKKYGRALFAPRVTRAGFMLKRTRSDQQMRDRVIRAVRRAVAPA